MALNLNDNIEKIIDGNSYFFALNHNIEKIIDGNPYFFCFSTAS